MCRRRLLFALCCFLCLTIEWLSIVSQRKSRSRKGDAPNLEPRQCSPLGPLAMGRLEEGIISFFSAAQSPIGPPPPPCNWGLPREELAALGGAHHHHHCFVWEARARGATFCDLQPGQFWAHSSGRAGPSREFVLQSESKVPSNSALVRQFNRLVLALFAILAHNTCTQSSASSSGTQSQCSPDAPLVCQALLALAQRNRKWRAVFINHECE